MVGSQDQIENKEIYIHEYNEVCSNIRNGINLRFAILTVYFAVLAGLIMISFEIKVTIQHSFLSSIAKGAGLIITMLFWTMEERTIDLLKHYFLRASENWDNF